MFFGVLIAAMALLGALLVRNRRAKRAQELIARELTIKTLLMPFTWYCVPVTSQMIAEGEEMKIILSFMEISGYAGQGEALFRQEPSNGAEHLIFFSPAAARAAPMLITAYSGRSCEAPSRSSVEFMVGDESTQQHLAP
jgi:hypothetical protein